MTLDQITILSCVIIGVAFFWLLINALRVKKGGTNVIKKSLVSDDVLHSLTDTKLAGLARAYQDSIKIKVNGSLKSSIPSSEFFSEFTVCKACGINTKIIDAGSGTLVGLGLLGTFLGLTLGIKNFDSSTSDQIQSSIQVLLSGMGTAFLTSLLGMSASLIYTIIEKQLRNSLSKVLFDFCEKLDDENYIDDVELSAYKQQVISENATREMVNQFNSATESLFEKFKHFLQYQGIEGNDVPLSNAIREILINTQEQTRALKSFSTDLALELNDRLDETLSRQMQQRLIPLMESVDATTKSVVEHIDQMAMQVSNPANDMIEHVVKELKESLMGIMEEFKSTLSKNATNELENLALSLGSATKAIGDFPQNMANISDVLQLTITEVKESIKEISNSSASANSSAMQQMQEQIVFATTSISNAISDVKEAMSHITQSSEQSSKDLIEKMAKSSSEMTASLQGTMDRISSMMQTSVQTMSSDLAGKQTDLLALQEGTTSEVKKIISEMSESWKVSSEAIIEQTENLLSRFDKSIERINATNEAVAGTMAIFQQAQSNITGTTSHLQTITGDMKNATELFRKGQSDYASSLEQIQTETSKKLNDVVELFEAAGNATDEYSQKFEIIRNGLSQIFTQIQAGLNEYSNSVRSSIQRYLEAYSTNLTNTTDALASTIQQQNEMVEMLVDTVNRKR
jgi:hypothetical protein